jgi:nucleotide-binding universal stress UspA family protein
MPIQRLMHATDFSPRAHAALRHAAELSGRLGCPLLILSCYVIPAYPLPEGAIIPSPSTLADDLGRTAKALEDEKRTAIELGAVGVETLVVEGTPASEIVRVARDRFVDMIIIGTHGRGAFTRALLGSVADKVIRTASCPVLVVHNDT